MHTTTHHDLTGLPLSGASGAAADAYVQAQCEFKCFLGDPAATVERAIAASPAMPMAYAFKAWLHLLGTEPGGLGVAQAACEEGLRLPATERERQHLHAAALLAAGRWHDAGRVLEDLAIQHPRDLLALQAGQQVDFFTGDARMLRDRIARALPAWDAGVPGWHAVLGMAAFGLEECGEYDAAERCGREAVDLERRDGWAWHAVAHVLEMRNRPAEGVRWLGTDTRAWSEGSFFAVHNWWHLALFRLELGNVEEVLRLYDAAIGGPGSGIVLDLLDQTALLWRLALRGADVGGRWQALADRWLATSVPGLYAFNDLHMAMACVGADRPEALASVRQAQEEALAGAGDNAAFVREVGLPAVEAVAAYGAGDFGRCVELLRRIRSGAHRFGGSHAQRDVLDLTLIAAARRGGQQALAQALLQERQRRRPDDRTLAA